MPAWVRLSSWQSFKDLGWWSLHFKTCFYSVSGKEQRTCWTMHCFLTAFPSTPATSADSYIGQCKSNVTSHRCGWNRNTFMNSRMNNLVAVILVYILCLSLDSNFYIYYSIESLEQNYKAGRVGAFLSFLFYTWRTWDLAQWWVVLMTICSWN